MTAAALAKSFHHFQLVFRDVRFCKGLMPGGLRPTYLFEPPEVTVNLLSRRTGLRSEGGSVNRAQMISIGGYHRSCMREPVIWLK